MVGRSALAKCPAVQCSQVQLEVQVCKAAVLGADAKLLPHDHSRPKADVAGLLLQGRLIADHSVDCDAGVHNSTAKHDASGNTFFSPLEALAA